MKIFSCNKQTINKIQKNFIKKEKLILRQILMSIIYKQIIYIITLKMKASKCYNMMACAFCI